MKNKARSKLADVLADIKNGKTQITQRIKTPQVTQAAVAKVSKPTPIRKTKTRVLKLFNRCVDLAQFDNCQDPQLYPVCRAWLHGYQQNKTQQDDLDMDSDLQDEDSAVTTTNTKQNDHSNNTNNTNSNNNQTTSNHDTNHNSSYDDNQIAENHTNEVYSLPTPRTKKEAVDAFKIDIDYKDLDNVDLRIPQSVRNFKPSENIEESLDKAISSMGHSECMQLNKIRWKQVKRDWSEARRIHEYLYEESFRSLCG